MSETHNTLPTDDRVTSLLADPEIQQGLTGAEAAIADYYRNLEANGKHTEPVIRGVTSDGDCIVAVKVSDVPRPAATTEQPENDDQAARYWQSVHYSVFAYKLDEATDPALIQSLSPRLLGEVRTYSGSGIDIDLAKPGDTITVTMDTLQERKDLYKTDRDAYLELSNQRRTQSEAADKLHLTQVPSDTPTFNGQPIISFEDAAFGKRRQAIVDQTVAPLVMEADKHVKIWADALGKDQTIMDKEAATRLTLNQRIKDTVEIMRANPEMVDRAGELVFDKAKAEYMAYEVNKIGPRKAGKAALQAAARYDADPLGVFEESAKGKGLFDRFLR